jgi:hypothetical protein
MKKGRKGELTSQQIVTLVILITGFIIILFFFYALNLKSGVDKESCRNSVILRGTTVGESVQLRCKTQDVCLSMGGKCTGAGKDVVTIGIENKEGLKEELSNLMYDCWYQMGEGKVDYLPAGFGSERNYCAICNRIYTDDNLKKNPEIATLSVKEFYTYLAERRAPGKDVSMLYYLHGATSLDEIFQSLGEKSNINYNFAYPQGYVLTTSLAKEGWGKTLIAAGAVGTLAVASVLTGGGALVTALIAGTAAGGAAGGIGFFTTGPGDTLAVPPALYPYDQENMRGLGCYEFSTLP